MDKVKQLEKDLRDQIEKNAALSQQISRLKYEKDVIEQSRNRFRDKYAMVRLRLQTWYQHCNAAEVLSKEMWQAYGTFDIDEDLRD